MRRTFFSVAALLFACAPALPLDASTLSTNFADVQIDNLKIGASYNLTESANMPMWIGYRGDGPVELKVSVVSPTATELKEGYEPIPDTSWVTVSRPSVSLLPDESENLDVAITIPRDEKYLGKKYQAYVHVVSRAPKETKGGMAISLALKGRVRFGIAPKPPTADELAALRRAERSRQGVIVRPERYEAVAALLQKSRLGFGITADEPLKIINSSLEKVNISLEAVGADVSGVSLPRGYAAGFSDDIVFSKTRTAIEPDRIENIGIFLKKTPAAKTFYVVKIIIKSPTLEVAKFVRIYVEGEGKREMGDGKR